MDAIGRKKAESPRLAGFLLVAKVTMDRLGLLDGAPRETRTPTPFENGF